MNFKKVCGIPIAPKNLYVESPRNPVAPRAAPTASIRPTMIQAFSAVLSVRIPIDYIQDTKSCQTTNESL